MATTLTLGTARAKFRSMPILGWPHATFEMTTLVHFQGQQEDLGVAAATFDIPMPLTPYMTAPPEYAAQFALGGFEIVQFSLHTCVTWSPMVHIHIPTAFAFEQQDIPVRARLVDEYRALVQIADVYVVKVRAFDLAAADPTADVFAIEVDPNDCMFDTLQTDGSYDADSKGYNFAYTIPGRETFLKGGGKYKLEYIVELDDGNPYTLTGAVAVRPVLSHQETPIA